MPTDLTAIRAQFPALAGPTVYLDNAGGSQVPRAVIDRARQATVGGYAARGAHYDSSMRGQETNRRAHEFARVMMNAGSAGEVVLGASTSYLSRMLSECYAEALPAG